MSSDYLHEDSLKLEKRLEYLREASDRAKQETQHGQSLNLDMGGQIKAAQDEVERLSLQIHHIEQVVKRIKAGFPYVEGQGFEDAVDATGEVATWTTLSDVFGAGTLVGNAQAQVRLPVRVQVSYALAVSSQLFESFKLCQCFEPSDDINDKPSDTTGTHYIFGTIHSPLEDEGSSMFLVAQWAGEDK